jgi:hypothetical protein
MATSEQAISCLFLYHVWLMCDVHSVFILVYKPLEDFVFGLGIQMSLQSISVLSCLRASL